MRGAFQGLAVVVFLRDISKRSWIKQNLRSFAAWFLVFSGWQACYTIAYSLFFSPSTPDHVMLNLFQHLAVGGVCYGLRSWNKFRMTYALNPCFPYIVMLNLFQHLAVGGVCYGLRSWTKQNLRSYATWFLVFSGWHACSRMTYLLDHCD